MNTKKQLHIDLTESVLFLRAVDFTGRRQTHENAPPSMLRGLLTLELSKSTRISSIEIELQGKTSTTVPDGAGPRRTEIVEENKIFSATQVFFRAASTALNPSRRALSVGTGLHFYRDECEARGVHAPTGEQEHAPAYYDGRRSGRDNNTEDSIFRGRGRTRRRQSADYSIHQRDPVLNTQPSRSPSPVPRPMYTPNDTPPFSPTAIMPVTLGSDSPLGHSSRSERSSVSHVILPPSGLDYEPRAFSQSASRTPSRTPSRAPSLSRPTYLATTSFTLGGSTFHESSSSGRVSSDDERPNLSRSQSRSYADSPHQSPSPVPQRDHSFDARGRGTSRFSLTAVSNSILDAVKERMRSNSPTVERGRSAGRILSASDEGHVQPVKENDNSRSHRHLPHPHPSALTKVGEKLGMDVEDHKEFGDGWKEFKKGIYTFPISFSVPSNMPPSLQCDFGSISWRLKAHVHRPGTFTTKMTAVRDVTLVSTPSEDDTEDTENIVVERYWDNQMQYLFSVSGRMFTIGGTIPIQMTFLPMSKMKIHRLSVTLEERVDYFVHQARVNRSDTGNRFTLLSLKYKDKESRPILPLIDDGPTAFANSPMYALVGPDDEESEMAAMFMGPGPWSMHVEVPLPSSLHPTNKNKKSNIAVTHMLKITMRVERGDDLHKDAKTNKRKLFDIVVQTPVHILSSLADVKFTSLPRYSETLDSVPSLFALPNTRASRPQQRRGNSLASYPTSAEGIARSVPLEDPDPPVESSSTLYDRNVTFERLITGQQSEVGEAPPAYTPA
ncbi:hypothetical protein OF83DRAFT_755726 [Amylostereum chailletii]|nr:hypothetical protein OF83DRAFT_755726 [Amylostereum chailletii]